MSFWDNRSLTLWHGTTLINAQGIMRVGPLLPGIGPSLDFGAGFYVTTRRHRARQWAQRKADRLNAQPALLSWKIEYDDFHKWEKLAFADGGKSADDFWQFVMLNRQNQRPHRTDGYFDVVIGPVSSFYQTRTVLKDMDQISFHTPKALEFLKSGSFRDHPDEFSGIKPVDGAVK